MVETQKRPTPHPCRVVKNSEGYLGWKDPSEEQGISTPCWDPQLRAPEKENGAHTASGGDDQWGICWPWKDRHLLDSGTLLKGQCTESCSQTFTRGSGRGGWLRAYWSYTEQICVAWHGGDIWTVSHQGFCIEDISHITLRCYIHWVEHCYPYSTNLGSALAQYSTFLHQHPAEPASCRKVWWLHPTGTFSILFLLGNSSWRLRQTLICVVQGKGPFFLPCVPPASLS